MVAVKTQGAEQRWQGTAACASSDIKAFPTSFPVDPKNSVTLGIGRAVKRDAVIVKVTTEAGIVGLGRIASRTLPGAVAHLVNTTLKQLVMGMDAHDVVGVWNKIYVRQLGSHGMGAGTCLAMSGIDMALWDIRGKALGAPLYRLLGGASKPIPAYAGGVSLGYQEPKALVAEARPLVEAGYKAIKLRVGDTPARDLARVQRCARPLGDDIAILVDANTGYTVADARKAMPGYDEHDVGWLEEPFPAHDYESYASGRPRSAACRLAAGENHYTRFEFNRLIEDGSVTILQPDLSKTGGDHRGAARGAPRLGMEVANKSAYLDDRAEHGGHDSLSWPQSTTAAISRATCPRTTCFATSWSASRIRWASDGCVRPAGRLPASA